MKDPDLVIVGAGPAGMMAGLLFARAGVPTLVLEKHTDFLRDFRGDTVHPSTMEILGELGMLDRFLARPHSRIDAAEIRLFGRSLKIGDLSHLPVAAPFIAMMPQWDFLDFLCDEAAAFPTFTIRRQAEVGDYVRSGGRVTGVHLVSGEQILARSLVIVADGRRSPARSFLPVHDLGAPIDVLWFRVPRIADGPMGLRAIADPGRVLVMIDRGDYWQCAFVVAKGSADAMRLRGIAAIRSEIEAAAPELGPLDAALPDFDAMKLLSVSLDRLERWHEPGLLVIGDAAHAMSPIGGVGINLAIQDAVAAANILAAPLARGRPVDGDLKKIQARRLFPTRVIQAAQKLAQENMIGGLLNVSTPLPRPPLALRLLNRFPLLRRIPGRLIGLGIRREHVRSPLA
jgi:2-polyprenyl-6-methoxyphenol hydroxylase-like FAD-dependent oxidoreductase